MWAGREQGDGDGEVVGHRGEQPTAICDGARKDKAAQGGGWLLGPVEEGQEDHGRRRWCRERLTCTAGCDERVMALILPAWG